MNIEKSNILIIDDTEDYQILMEEALIQFIQEPNAVLTGTSEECFLELSKVNYDVEQFVDVIDGNKQRKQNGNLYCSV